MVDEQSNTDKREKIKKSEERFPPELTKCDWWVIIIPCYAISFILAGYILAQTRMFLFFGRQFSFPDIYLSYAAFAVILVSLLIIRYTVHKINENKCRRVDPSEVQAMFTEERTVEPRLITKKDKTKKPDEYDKKKNELSDEVKRLEELGNKGWTEYRVLSLDQMLIDFLKIDDLIARARSRLTELGEYAEDASIDLEKRQYFIWEDKINEAIRSIENIRRECGLEENEHELKVDKCAEKLRAETREMLDSVANYEYNWALGSAIMRALYIYGVQAIFLLLAMGLLPLYHSMGKGVIGLFNWGILGISGSIAAVLLDFRKSNYVEVGYTLGKKEMWRAVLGAGLGLVAGILLYSMIAGGLLKGGILPTLCGDQNCENIYLSIFWAIAAGFSFEMIFERLRSAMGNV